MSKRITQHLYGELAENAGTEHVWFEGQDARPSMRSCRVLV